MKTFFSPSDFVLLFPGVQYSEKLRILTLNVKQLDVSAIPAWERPNDWELAAAYVRYVRNGHPKITIEAVAVGGLVDF